MKLAAVDIGSNAIRLQIVKAFEQNDLVSFKKLEFLRFPLRLGEEVFREGVISGKTLIKFEKLMHTFKNLIDLYEVDAYQAVATSAMREANNGKDIKQQISKKVGLDIDIISGKSEARILYKSIIPYLKDGYYIHIDVGGGSTELNIFKGRKLMQSNSFKIGSVRQLTLHDRRKAFDKMKKWINSVKFIKDHNFVGIGTGGNINKLYNLANKANNQTVSYSELKALRAYVKEFTYKQRISILKFNPDRADVIIPASDIYIKVLKEMKSDYIIVPKVGLKDGIIYELFEHVTKKNIDQLEFL